MRIWKLLNLSNSRLGLMKSGKYWKMRQVKRGMIWLYSTGGNLSRSVCSDSSQCLSVSKIKMFFFSGYKERISHVRVLWLSSEERYGGRSESLHCTCPFPKFLLLKYSIWQGAILGGSVSWIPLRSKDLETILNLLYNEYHIHIFNCFNTK